MSHLPHLVGHFTLSQALQFVGPLPFLILLSYGEQLCIPAWQHLKPSHPPAAFRSSLQAQS